MTTITYEEFERVNLRSGTIRPLHNLVQIRGYVIKLSHRMVKRKRMSFLAQEAAARIKGSSIVALASIIDWSRLRKIMGKLDRTNYGPKGYEAIKMLKALILQNWYSLSDTKLEEALRVRLDFMVITELSEVPDSTTICRFRNKLIQEKVMEKILKEINNELEQKGLKIKESKGAILDATIIASCSRPHKRLETIAVDREEEVVHEVIT
jgi:IS5 family transposase